MVLGDLADPRGAFDLRFEEYVWLVCVPRVIFCLRTKGIGLASFLPGFVSSGTRSLFRFRTDVVNTRNMASLYAVWFAGDTTNVNSVRSRSVYHDWKSFSDLADLARECIDFTDNKLKESAIATGE